MKYMLIVALIAAVGTTHAQTRWRLATGYSADSFHTQNIEQFASDVAKATGGTLKIEVRPNGSLFKLGDIFQAVRDAKVAAGETIMTSLVKEMPIAGADAIPFVVGSYPDAWRMWTLQRPLIDKHFESRGLKALFAVPWPAQGLYSRTPVKSAKDFEGTNMRTYNPTTVRIAQMLRANPVDVPMTQVRQALILGRVDNMITSAATGVENEVWGAINYYYDIKAWFPKNIVFVNLAAYRQLQPAEKQAVNEAAQRAEKRGWARSESVAAEFTNELKDRGIQVDRMPINFEAHLKRMGESFSREWVRSVGNEANDLFIPYYIQR
jgi:TRAP-type transport system periplasmic protein